MYTRQTGYETWDHFDDDLGQEYNDKWTNDVPQTVAATTAPIQTPTTRQATGSPHNDSHCTDLWSPTPEQRAYYLSQFIRLQPDPRAKLGGSLAKAFFDLSKLPNSELSHIWELADADGDGQLTLGEFSMAMHLVVLRRNGLPVPRFLPPTLAQMLISQSVFTGPPFDSNRVSSAPTVSDAMGSGSPVTFPPSVPLSSTTVRQRRWSISSQSDISSLAEGNAHLDTKQNSDPRLQHPAPLKARTLPLTNAEFPALLDSDLLSPSSPRAVSPSPPTPPPRVRLPGLEPVVIDAFSSDHCLAVLNQKSLPKVPVQSTLHTDEDRHDDNDDAAPALRLDFDPAVARLQSECDSVMRTNERLTVELMELQQQRICLELLLDRLLPLNASSTASSVSNT